MVENTTSGQLPDQSLNPVMIPDRVRCFSTSRYPELATKVPDLVLDGLLGKGWSYADWQRDIEAQHYVWSENLKNRIIKREYLRFKPEIALLLQVHTPGTPRSTSRVYYNILRRLRGKTGERAERIRNGNLFGSDAK